MAAIPCGGIVVGHAEMNGGKSAVISISDSAPGIGRTSLRKFDPFFTAKEQGMGIGLSIARSIMLAREGRVWVENQREAE